MTLAEAKAEFEKWSTAHDTYMQEYLPIMNALAKSKTQAGNAWLLKLRERKARSKADKAELEKLGGEMTLADFAYDNARQEYFTTLDKFRVRRDAARYYIEDLEATA